MQTVTVLFEEAAQILNVLQLLQISEVPQDYPVTREQLGQLASRLEEVMMERDEPSQFPIVAQVPTSTNNISNSSEKILVLRRISGRLTDNIIVAQRFVKSPAFDDEIRYINTEATPAGMSAIRALAQLIE